MIPNFRTYLKSMVSRNPPWRTPQAESASVVVAVERLTHNVLRCLSDVVQHRAEVPGGPLGLHKGLGGSSKTGENSGIFMDFSLNHVLPTSKRVILLANEGIYSIWFKADRNWWCFLLIGIWPARALVFISQNVENSATFSNIQVEVASKKFFFRKKTCVFMSTYVDKQN